MSKVACKALVGQAFDTAGLVFSSLTSWEDLTGIGSAIGSGRTIRDLQFVKLPVTL